MRTFTTFLVLAVFALPVTAQQALNEQFNYSSTFTFPPTGWYEVNNNLGPNLGWEETSVQLVSLNGLGFDAAGHDDFGFGTTNDFRLCTSEFDLVDFDSPRLMFDESIGYSNFMAHHPAALGDGYSKVEASTDGVTWVEVWSETRTVDFPYFGIETPMDFLAGVPGVQLAFHYYGTFAHTWVVDNVVVDNGPAEAPTLEVMGTCPGSGCLDLTNMTPFGTTYIGWSFDPGLYLIPAGPCAEVVLPISNPTLLYMKVADQFGAVRIKRALPPIACGKVYLIGVDVDTCTPTNVVAL